MSGVELKKAIVHLGISFAKFSRISELSIPTLNKIFDGVPVSDYKLATAINTVSALKEQQAKELQKRLKTATG